MPKVRRLRSRLKQQSTLTSSRLRPRSLPSPAAAPSRKRAASQRPSTDVPRKKAKKSCSDKIDNITIAKEEKKCKKESKKCEHSGDESEQNKKYEVASNGGVLPLQKDFCSQCGQSLDDPDLIFFQGNPQNSIEENDALTAGNVVCGIGHEGLPLCNFTSFSIFDEDGHMCRLDNNLIERGVELFISGYLKDIQNQSPCVEEDSVPIQKSGPITEWWIESTDGETDYLRITTELGEYQLVQPSTDYAPFMENINEKIWISKMVIDYLKMNDHLEPTYRDLVKAITADTIPEWNNNKITEDIIHKHSKFLFDQVSLYEDDDDEICFTSLPCMREVFKMSGDKYQESNSRCIKKRGLQLNSLESNKEQQFSKATTTPLVRNTFETLFLDELDKVQDHEVKLKKRCKICDGCQKTDCGDCAYCKNMSKFNGTGHSEKECMQRVCSANRVDISNGEEKDDENIDCQNDYQFAEAKSKSIDWFQVPIKIEKEASYFTSVQIGGIKYKTGDCVLIQTLAENVPCLVGRIVYIYRERRSPKLGYFHCELFMRSSNTVLGAVGNPREVFRSDHCYHGIPLSSIIKKVIVEKRNTAPGWFTCGGESVTQEVHEDNGSSYYYQKYYDRFTARFVDIPEDPPCLYIDKKHRFCPSCERKTTMDFKEIPTVIGKVQDNCVEIYEFKKTEWSLVRWRDVDYKKDCCVFLRPDALKLPDSYRKKNEKVHQSRKDVDENVYPEYYRKNKSSNQFNMTARRAFAIGIIVSITSEGWGQLIDPHKIFLKIRVMYRPENTTCRKPQSQDLNSLYWSDRLEEVSFMCVVGPCQLYYIKNIPVKTMQWLEQDPTTFYFNKAYNPLKKNFFEVPKEVRSVYKKECHQKSTEETEFKPLRTLDVFAGCGGLSAGLLEAGVADCRWAIENEENAARSFKLNNKDCTVLVKDCNVILNDILSERHNEKLPKKGDVELLCGGPPCQGFSAMNRFSSREYSKFKNSLVVTLLSYCDYYRPKYFILENVRNFVSFKKGLLVKLTLRALLDIGYQCTFAILQAGSYGVPQTRKRLIILASAPGYELPLYPEPVNTFNKVGCRLSTRIDGKLFTSNISTFRSAPRRTITIYDAMSDLPEIQTDSDEQALEYITEPLTHFQKLARIDDAPLTDHVCKKFSALAQERIKHVPTEPGADWRDLPNIEVTISNGTVIQKLKYQHHDKKQGKSKSGLLRGVCACAAGGACSKKTDRQENTLIPWGMVHSSNRNGNWNGVYGRLSWFNYFRTTITDPEPSGMQGRVLHPEQHRVISVRECARSQGFSDSYLLSGSVMDKHRQIGNAVPPPMAAAIGREIKKTLMSRIKIREAQLNT